MEAYGEVEIQLHVGLFLISTLAVDKWPASFPGPLTPEKKNPLIPTGHKGRAGPTAGLVAMRTARIKMTALRISLLAPDAVGN
jgi:hypothetical protein